MRRLLLSLLCIAPVMVAGCSGPKAPVSEDFTDLAGLDDKSDAFSYRMKLLGSLDYGQTSGVISYKSTPRFRAFKFGGQAGDQVDAWVRSTNGGDAVAWVLDNGFNVIASNDDAPEGGLDSHVTATLTANADPSIVTYYVVFRDYDLHSKKFTVELSGKSTNDFFSCTTDADCVAVPKHMCCPDCSLDAVNKDQTEAYANAPLVCPAVLCPKACRLDTRVAQCNFGTNKCEMVAVADIACGGFTAHPHACPADYQCTLPISHPDIPGKCTPKPQACGGIAGIACPTGEVCVDDPSDSCDPTKGGADCGGICQPAVTDCRTTGCATGSNCQICWASWSCVPDGAEC